MGIELLFILLAILYGLESVSSIARATGIWSGNVYNGIVVQNALALFSRLVMFLFMPVMGYFFDKGNSVKISEILFGTLGASLSLVIVALSKKFFFDVLHGVAAHVKDKGKLGFIKSSCKQQISLKRVLPHGRFVILYIIAYVPYYLAWPVTIYLLGIYNEFRATLIALPTVFTGLNTLAVSLYIDPYLTKYIDKNETNVYINVSLVNLRLKAYFTAVMLLCISLIILNV